MANRLTAALAVVAVCCACAAPAAAAPTAVERAVRSTAVVKRDHLSAVAFAIDDRGGFLTTEQAASRGSDITLVFRDGTEAPAAREESDAPAGLALLRVQAAGSINAPPLRFAGSSAGVGDRVWLVPPSQVHAPTPAALESLPGAIEAAEGLVMLSRNHRRGTTGSPVVNPSGEIVAVVRAPRGGLVDRRAQAVSITEAPQVLPAITSPKRNDFPAVPLVVGIGVLLLIANLLFTIRRRREARDVIVAARTPGEVEATPAPAPEPLDDLEVTLKRDRPSHAVAADDPDEPDLIKLT